MIKTGWWYVANEPPPDTGVLAAPQPPAPNSPAGTMPVASLLGESTKVSAMEFELDAEIGSTLKGFELVLRESSSPGAALGSTVASVVACPVTEIFWADGAGAAWKNKPTYDCELAEAAGVRDEDGLWTFNLKKLAADWLSEDFFGSRSIVLVENVDPPFSFDVSFEGPQTDGIGLDVRAKAPAKNGNGGNGGTGGGGGGGTDGNGGSAGGNTGGGSLGGSDGGGFSGGGNSGGGSLDGSDSGSLGGTDSGSPEASGGGEAAGGSENGTDTGMVPVAANVTWYSGLPKASLLMLPLILGLAYLMMLALGPNGRPSPTANRRGVSRALDRLRESRGFGSAGVA